MLKKIKHHYQKHKLKKAQKKEEKQRKMDYIRNFPSAYDDALISWNIPGTVQYHRGPIWKILAVLFVFGTIVWGIFYDAWTFSAAIAAFVLAYGLTHYKKQPKDISISISDIGIRIGSKKFSYPHIRAFWIIYEPPYVQTLNLRVVGDIISDISIQLNGQNPAEIRELLLGKIPELEGQHEKLGDLLLRLLKL